MKLIPKYTLNVKPIVSDTARILARNIIWKIVEDFRKEDAEPEPCLVETENIVPEDCICNRHALEAWENDRADKAPCQSGTVTEGQSDKAERLSR